jgi:hypothetical protein
LLSLFSVGGRFSTAYGINVDLHPELISEGGEKQFAVSPFDEYVELTEWIEDVEDLLQLKTAKEAEQNEPSTSPDEVEKEFGIK